MIRKLIDKHSTLGMFRMYGITGYKDVVSFFIPTCETYVIHNLKHFKPINRERTI